MALNCNNVDEIRNLLKAMALTNAGDKHGPSCHLVPSTGLGPPLKRKTDENAVHAEQIAGITDYVEENMHIVRSPESTAEVRRQLGNALDLNSLNEQRLALVAIKKDTPFKSLLNHRA